jgi:hypothetical protein
MKAVTGVAISIQVIIANIVTAGNPHINLANIPLLLADRPRLLFHPPPKEPWYNNPPVSLLLHNVLRRGYVDGK